MNKVFFFCQASGDIIHILQAVHKEHEKNGNIDIIVLCLYEKLVSTWNFLSIPFIKVFYLPRYYAPISKPWKYFLWKQKVYNLLNNIFLFEKKQNYRIYFTSIYDDSATAYYIHLLSRYNNELYYLNHYDDKQAIYPLKKISFKDKLRIFMFRKLTNIHFELYYMSGRWNVIRFPKERYIINDLTSEIDINICSKYAYKIAHEGKNVLFFSQPNRDLDLISDEEYEQLHFEVVKRLKEKGYYIVQKGHPIIGLYNKIEKESDLIIPSLIPSELINMSSFDLCIGFMTIALASSAKMNIPSYTFLSLMKNHTSKSYIGAVDFINSTSDNKILYLSSINDIN